MGAPEGHSRPQEAPEGSLRPEAPGAPRSHRRSLEAPASTGQLRVPRRPLIIVDGLSLIVCPTRIVWMPAHGHDQGDKPHLYLRT